MGGAFSILFILHGYSQADSRTFVQVVPLDNKSIGARIGLIPSRHETYYDGIRNPPQNLLAFPLSGLFITTPLFNEYELCVYPYLQYA